MAVTKKMMTLLDRLEEAETGATALVAAINALTFKHKGAWRNMTAAEAEEISTLFQQLPASEQATWRKGYTAERNAIQALIDAGKDFKGAHHQAADADTLKDFNRMLKVLGA